MLNELKNFQILHHYLTSFLLKTKLTNQSYTELLTILCSFEVLGTESDKDCTTVYMRRAQTTEDDFVDVPSSNKMATVLNIDTDGSIELESLYYYAYPRRKEYKRFFEHNRAPKLTYRDPQAIVDYHLLDLEIEEVLYLEIDMETNIVYLLH